MNRLLIVFSLVLSSFTFADTYTGRVKHFEGLTVETAQPYSYYALATQQGLRVILPSYLNEKELHRTQDLVVVEADLEVRFCTDMSQACPSGVFKNIDSVVIDTGIVSARPFDTFFGYLNRFQGRFVETPSKTYDYFAVETRSRRRISVPTQINAKELYELKLSPSIIISGHARPLICTDMSPACGPELITVLQSVQLDFTK